MESDPLPPVAPSAAVRNVADLLTRAREATPDEPALVDAAEPRRELTWAELDAQVDAVASGLAAVGLVAGHRVALLGPNSLEHVVAYLAALRAGFVVVPLDPAADPVETLAKLADCGAQVVFAAPGLPTGQAHPVELSAAGLAGLAARAGGPVTSPADAEALAVLLYTAGTSGEPKAAMLSHRALLAHLDHVAAVDLIAPGSTVLAMLPLFHVFGLNAVLGSWLRAGGRLVLLDGYPDDLAAVLRSEDVDILPLAPAVLDLMLADDRLAGALTEVTVVSGAAPLTDELRTAFVERTGARLEQGYGLTEAAPGVSVTVGGEERGHGHVGRLLPGVEVRIGDGSEPAEPGEIWVRGDNLFSGYWPGGTDGPDADGWFATGDIGYLEGDELFLVDRARELVTVHGFHVFPAEVEQALVELPGVSAAAVVGQPDASSGERVVAFVTGEGLSEQAVRDWAAQRLAPFKRPALVRVVPELPRGATGKIKKGLLRASLTGGDGSVTP